MANEKKEVLRLTVPRRHVLAAAMCVSTEEARPILNHICFRPATDYGTTQGGLVTIATNAHKLVELTGGEWEGKWPSDRPELLILPDCFSRKKAKRLLDTNITVRLFDDDEIETIDEAVRDRPFKSEGRKHPGVYPDIDRVFKSYGRFAIAKDKENLDARYLEDMGKIGSIFSDKPTKPVRILLRRRAVGEMGGAKVWHPVFTMEAESSGAERSMRVILHGYEGHPMKVWQRYTATNLPLWGVHRHRSNAIASAKELEADGTAKKYGYGEIAVKQVEYEKDTMTVRDE